MELKVDLARYSKRDELGTGILVRAKHREKWGNYDIEVLDTKSLKIWLRSRGGDNSWAETTVATLLGHSHQDIKEAWAEPPEVQPEVSVEETKTEGGADV